MDLFRMLPKDWREALSPRWPSPTVAELEKRLAAEGEFYPPQERIFAALEATPLADVRCVLLGQDPYHEPGQAMGLAFAVPSGVRQPPSLRNLIREYQSDLGVELPKEGISVWARHGVLMLNTVLTVRPGAARSHHRLGWLAVTECILQTVNALPRTIAFLLLGSDAAEYASRISQRHVVVCGVHPSPLSAHRGFFGSRPFSTVNRLLSERGCAPIDWNG